MPGSEPFADKSTELVTGGGDTKKRGPLREGPTATVLIDKSSRAGRL